MWYVRKPRHRLLPYRRLLTKSPAGHPRRDETKKGEVIHEERARAGDDRSNPERFLYEGIEIVIVFFDSPAIGNFEYNTSGIPSMLHLSVTIHRPTKVSKRSPSDMADEVLGFLV